MQSPSSKIAAASPRTWFRTIAQKLISMPVVLGALLVAGACADRYLNLLNVSLHQKVYSPYCFEGDTWLHMAVGGWILKHHRLPTHDFYSFTAYGNPWVAVEWLGEVLIELVWRLGGMQALMILLVIMASTIVLLIYYLAYLRSRNIKAAFLASALLLPVASLPLSMRPQLFGYLFLIVTMIILEKFRQGHSKALWLLPFLFWLWVNTHGTFALGFLLLGIYWISGLWEFRLGEIYAKRWTPTQRRQLELTVLFCLIASILTPYGTRLAAYPLIMVSLQPLIPRSVPEWRPVNLGQFYGMWFLILLLIFLFGQLIARKSYGLAEVAMLTFATIEAFIHARFMLLFAPVFAPILALLLAEWVPNRTFTKPIRTLNFALTSVACFVVIFFFPSRARLQKAVELWNPVGAVHYLQQHPVKGPMFDTGDWGGYLVWKFGPGHRVFMDGRLDLYVSNGVLSDYLRISQIKPDAQFLLRKYGIRSCLIAPDTEMASYLAILPGWREVYRDKSSIIFTRVLRRPSERTSKLSPPRISGHKQLNKLKRKA